MEVGLCLPDTCEVMIRVGVYYVVREYHLGASYSPAHGVWDTFTALDVEYWPMVRVREM